MASDNKKISDFDNLASGSIQDTDQVEVGRPSTKNFKFTWANLKAALKTYFDTLYATLTNFNSHKARHQNGGADEVSIAGLDGESTELATHKAVETVGVHGSTVAATANKLAHRDANGRTKVANGAVSGDVVNKGQLDLKEDVANKKTDLTDNSDVYYPSQQAVKEAVDAKMADPLTTEGDIVFRNTTVPARLAIGTAGEVLTVNAGATAPEWVAGSVGDTTSKVFTADDNLRHSNDTEQSMQGQAYVKKKEILLDKDIPACRIKFDIKNDSGFPYDTKAKIYKNGVALGTEQTTDTTSYVTKTEDFTDFVSGDLIQIYICCPEHAGVINFVQNMRIYFSYTHTITHIGREELVTPLDIVLDYTGFATNQDP